MLKCTDNLKSFRAREQNMFEWRQEPCQFRDVTDKVSLPKVTLNQTKPLRLKRKHTRKNRHASGLNENGSIKFRKKFKFAFHETLTLIFFRTLSIFEQELPEKSRFWRWF